ILNSVNRTAEKNILEKLREIDAELSEEVDSLMFLFEDIAKLSNEAIQHIVKEVNSKTLALSLKAASKELKDRIFKNMTERAAEMLEDELQYLGPVRVRDVESAQKQILDIIHELEESGKIEITHNAEDEEIIE
ncbi:MAG TPA: flagellar motor switch protein FliG, partial [Candidatus Marinimicrobia bacterium]|nr:flagellar motor switch protein FliG [Candidatus Neomarinimicrobiota bacterium]